MRLDFPTFELIYFHACPGFFIVQKTVHDKLGDVPKMMRLSL